MSTAVAWGFLILVVGVFVGVGWWLAYDHGGDEAKKDAAKGEVDAANARARDAEMAPANPREANTVLRRHLERLSRRLRKTRAGRQ